MAYLSAKEIRSMPNDERQKSLKDLRQDLVHERGIAAMGGSPPSPGKIRQIRRQISRILTIENEERQGVRGQTRKAPAPEAAPKKAAPKKAPAKASKAKKPAAAKAPAKKPTKKEATRRNE